MVVFLRSCGGVLVLVFLWWCGGVCVVVFLWWCCCGDVLVSSSHQNKVVQSRLSQTIL